MSRKYIHFWGMLLIILALASGLVAACSQSGSGQRNASSATATSTGGGTGTNCAHGTVHTLATSFQETCVDVAKGESLKVVPVVQSVHILANGSWVNNTAQPSKEPGAPTVANVHVTGNTVKIGVSR